MLPDRHASDFRLRKHAEYQRVYKAARKKHGRLLAYFFAQRPPWQEDTAQDTAHEPAASKPTAPKHTAHRGIACVPSDGPRIGLTVPKALGKAVVRNRIKRRMRAAVRSCIPLLSSPVDVILHPRRNVEDCPFAALEEEVSTIFRAVQASQRSAPASERSAQAAQSSVQTSQRSVQVAGPREQTREEARPSQRKSDARPQGAR